VFEKVAQVLQPACTKKLLMHEHFDSSKFFGFFAERKASFTFLARVSSPRDIAL
jgi:hypothetical protein